MNGNENLYFNLSLDVTGPHSVSQNVSNTSFCQTLNRHQCFISGIILIK